jgi:hypothetical protein
MKFDIACLFFTSIALLLVESQGNAKSFRKLNKKKSTPKRVLEDKGGGKGKGKGGKRTDDDTTRRNDDGCTDDEPRGFDDGEISNDDSELQAICVMFNDYQDLKDSNDIDACEPFNRQSDLLCPSPYEGGNICDVAALNQTSLLPSINENYCVPLLDELYRQLSVGIVDTCINSCVHYLSPEHGDCCDFGCID